MLSQTVIYLPSIVGVFLLGLFVILQSKRTVFRLFGALSFSIVLWLTLQYLTDARIGNTLLWLQGASAISFLLALSFVSFVLAFPDYKLRVNFWLILLCIPPALLIPLSFTALCIRSVFFQGGELIIEAGPLFDVQTYTLIAYLMVGLAILIARVHHVDKMQRSQIYLLISAFMIGMVGSVLAGVIFAESTLWQIARPLSILIMLGIIAYAMIYHKLFDIRSYAVRAGGYTLTFALIAAIYVIAAVFPAIYFMKAPLNIEVIVYLSALTLIVASLFHPLRVYFNKITNRIFFRDYYEPQDVLDQISRLLVGTVDINEIRTQSAAILDRHVHLTSTSFLLIKEVKGPQKHLLDFLLNSELNMIVVENMEPTSMYAKSLRRLDTVLAIRLQTAHEDLGFLLLGPRRSGVPYGSSDKKLFNVIASELAVGLQNALRFEEIENFNTTLQERIADATKKLRRTNEKLRQLDQTKDDFISMASHQLRTPLTSVKGYVSMVLDGDAGKLTKLQRKLLGQSFISAQRMVYLISDLLNVSRLRTGKFVIEPVPTNLAKIIKDEVDQLLETAKGRDLTLTFNKPEHFPTYLLDETKMRQVIMNFIDNAIYYTPAGGNITINLLDKPSTIELTVVDDGIGVPREEQHHLFTKFFRAHNAKRARPDGTGLGLFMAKKVVVAQGGAIIFKSQEHKGSTFGFTFAKDKLKSVPEK